MADIERVKANIQKMISAKAPESEIDGYIQSEGLTLEDLQKKDSLKDYASSFIGGVNTIVPTMLGMPVDVATNIANLGIAGYGAAKGLLGSTNLPETLPPQVGGSEWMKQKITGLMGGDPFSPPDPTSHAQQNISMAGGIMGAGLIAPAQGIRQAAANVARMAPAAAGAVAGREIAPNQPLAPMAGAMLGLSVPKAINVVKSKLTPPVEAFVKAHKLGYIVPPSHGKPSALQQTVEGLAGPVPTKQQASVHNQNITNKLVKQDIGYPEDVSITHEGLTALRNQLGKSYSKVKEFGTIKTDPTFTTSLGEIAHIGSALSREIPGLVKKDIVKLTNMFRKKAFSAEALVDAVKQLRADSSSGFRSQDPGQIAVARAKGKIANQIEGLIERNAQERAPALVPELKTARTTIAKTYQVENALKGDNVDAVALGRLLDKGKPMTGLTRSVAEFGQHFKHSAQINPPQTTNFRPMDVVTGIGGMVASGNMAGLAAAGIRPALRKVILSKPYQNLVAKMPPEDWDMVLSLPPASQVAAMAALLKEDRKDSQSQK